MTYQGTAPGKPFVDHTPQSFKQAVFDSVKNETHYFDYEDRITFGVSPSGFVILYDADEDTAVIFDLVLPRFWYQFGWPLGPTWNCPDPVPALPAECGWPV